MNSQIKGTLFLSIATGVFMITGYLINILLGRFLGPVNYGIYGVMITLISFINIIQTSGITQGLSKHISEGKEDEAAILKTGLILQTLLNLLFFGLFFIFSEEIALVLKDKELEPFIKICAFVFPLYGLYALYLDYYNGLHLFKKQALINISYSISKLFFVLILGFFYQLYGVFFGFILAPIVPLLIGFKFPKKNVRLFSIKKLFVFSLPLIGVAIFSNLLFSIDIFFVKTLMFSKESVGYYTAAQNISRLVFYSMSAFFLVIFPSISHAVSNNLDKKTKNIIQYSFRTILLLVCPMVVLISGTSGELIEIIYSSKYLPSSSSLSILVLGIGAFTLFTALTYILSGAGKPLFASVFSLMGLIITIFSCAFLIPKYGLEGAAMSTTIGSCVSLFVAGIFIYKYFNTFIPLLSIFRILIASIFLYLLLDIISFYYLYLPLVYIMFFVLYFIILYITKEIKKDDLFLLKFISPKWLLKII